MVAETLIFHPTVTHYLKFVATTVGREKLLRILQYFSRFYAWYLYRTNGRQITIAALNAIKRQAGLIRKVLRVGKNIEHLRAAAVAASGPLGPSGSGPDPFLLRVAAVARQLAYCSFLTFDMMTIPDSLGVFRNARSATFQRESYRAWTIGLVCGIFLQTYSWTLLRARQRRLDKREGDIVIEGKKIAREIAATKLQLTADICDLTIPLSALGLVKFDDGFVGICGTLSSLIGAYSQWDKTA